MYGQQGGARNGGPPGLRGPVGAPRPNRGQQSGYTYHGGMWVKTPNPGVKPRTSRPPQRTTVTPRPAASPAAPAPSRPYRPPPSTAPRVSTPPRDGGGGTGGRVYHGGMWVSPTTAAAADRREARLERQAQVHAQQMAAARLHRMAVGEQGDHAQAYGTVNLGKRIGNVTNLQRGAPATGGPGMYQARDFVRRGYNDPAQLAHPEKVMELQHTLRDAGYLMRIDGRWGPQTQHAYEDYVSQLRNTTEPGKPLQGAARTKAIKEAVAKEWAAHQQQVAQFGGFANTLERAYPNAGWEYDQQVAARQRGRAANLDAQRAAWDARNKQLGINRPFPVADAHGMPADYGVSPHPTLSPQDVEWYRQHPGQAGMAGFVAKTAAMQAYHAGRLGYLNLAAALTPPVGPTAGWQKHMQRRADAANIGLARATAHRAVTDVTHPGLNTALDAATVAGAVFTGGAAASARLAMFGDEMAALRAARVAGREGAAAEGMPAYTSEGQATRFSVKPGGGYGKPRRIGIGAPGDAGPNANWDKGLFTIESEGGHAGGIGITRTEKGVLGGRFKGPFALKNARGDTIATFDSENQAVRYAKARAKEIYQRAKAGETEAAGARKLPSHLEIVSAAAKAATRGIPDAAEGGRIVRNIRRYANLARVARGKGARWGASAEDQAAAKSFDQAVRDAQDELHHTPARQELIQSMKDAPGISPSDARTKLRTMDWLAVGIAKDEGIPVSSAWESIYSHVEYHDLNPTKADLAAQGTTFAQEGSLDRIDNLAHVPDHADHGEHDWKAVARELLDLKWEGKPTKTGRPGQDIVPKAPPGHQDVESLAKLLEQLHGRALAGQNYRHWYKQASDAILHYVGGDKEEAKKLAQLVAIYSPQSEVYRPVTMWNNLDRALNAYHEHQVTGKVSDVYSISKNNYTKSGVKLPDWQTNAAQAVMDGEQNVNLGEALKANNFYHDFLAHYDLPAWERRKAAMHPADRVTSTQDLWMRRAFKYPTRFARKDGKAIHNEPGFSDAEYRFANAATEKIAEKLGWSPRQVQAAIWAQIKSEVEGTELGQGGIDYSHALEHVGAFMAPEKEARDVAVTLTKRGLMPKKARDLGLEQARPWVNTEEQQALANRLATLTKNFPESVGPDERAMRVLNWLDKEGLIPQEEAQLKLYGEVRSRNQAIQAAEREAAPSEGKALTHAQEEDLGQKLDRLSRDRENARAEWEHKRQEVEKREYRRLRAEDKEAGKDVSGKSVAGRRTLAHDIASRDPEVRAAAERMDRTDLAYKDVANPEQAARDRAFMERNPRRPIEKPPYTPNPHADTQERIAALAPYMEHTYMGKKELDVHELAATLVDEDEKAFPDQHIDRNEALSHALWEVERWQERQAPAEAAAAEAPKEVGSIQEALRASRPEFAPHGAPGLKARVTEGGGIVSAKGRIEAPAPKEVPPAEAAPPKAEAPKGPPVKGTLTETDKGNVLRLYKGADMSTLIHEMGHALQGRIAPDMKPEEFARSMEQYFMNGHAPHKDLQAAFDHTAVQMAEIYKGAAVPGSKLNPQIGKAFDRFFLRESLADPKFAATAGKWWFAQEGEGGGGPAPPPERDPSAPPVTPHAHGEGWSSEEDAFREWERQVTSGEMAGEPPKIDPNFGRGTRTPTREGVPPGFPDDLKGMGGLPEGVSPEEWMRETGIGRAKGARTRQEPMMAEGRAIKAENLAAARAKYTGLPRYIEMRKAAQGQLPKIDFEGFKELDGHAVLKLLDHIADNPKMQYWEVLRGQQAIIDALNGRTLQRNEIATLEKAFGKKTAGGIRELKHSRIRQILLDAYNLPRSIQSAFDYSAPLRQGLVMGARHPGVWAKAWGPMLKASASQGAYESLLEDLATRPNIERYRKGGLSLPDLPDPHGQEGGMLAAMARHEERYPSGFTHYIPGIKQSERAYNAFLMKLRADSFDHILKLADKRGKDINDPEFLQKLGSYVNAATGRGDMPVKSMEKAAPFLNGFLFSPRLLASRGQFLGVGSMYWKGDPWLRWQALRAAGHTAAGVSTILGLALLAKHMHAPGTNMISVGHDPRNADFGKLRLGKARIDLAGGFLQDIRAAAQMASGKVVSSSTGKVIPLSGGPMKSSPWDVGERYLISKFNPAMSLASDVLHKKTFEGKPVTVKGEAYQHGFPMLWQDAINFAQDAPGKNVGSALSRAAAALAVGGVGVGVQSYGKPGLSNATRSSLQQGAKKYHFGAPTKQQLESAKVEAQISKAKSGQKPLEQEKSMLDLYQQIMHRPYPERDRLYTGTNRDATAAATIVANAIRAQAPGTDYPGMKLLQSRIRYAKGREPAK